MRHGSAHLHREAVYGLAEKIEAGDVLTPYLSERISKFAMCHPKKPNVGSVASNGATRTTS